MNTHSLNKPDSVKMNVNKFIDTYHLQCNALYPICFQEFLMTQFYEIELIR
jgi:hypothetical protein